MDCRRAGPFRRAAGFAEINLKTLKSKQDKGNASMKYRTINFTEAVLCFFLAGVTHTLALPKESTEPIYSAKSVIYIFNANPADNPHFLNTQMLILQSTPVLYEVIQRLGLQKAWGKDQQELPRSETLQILKNSIHISQIPNTTLISISVKRSNPNEAAKIANETAVTFRDYRLSMASKNARAKINALTNVLKEQRDRVDAAQRVIENQRTELSLPPFREKNSVKVDRIRLQQLEADRLMAQSEMVKKEGLLKILEDLDDNSLVERASYIPPDPFVLNTLQQLRGIDVQLCSLAADHEVDHPEVQRAALLKRTLEETLRKRLQDLRNGLETEYLMAKNRFESIDKVLAEMRASNIETQSPEARSVRKAQMDLESERFIYKQLEAKLRVEIATLEVPRATVEIISVAEPNPVQKQ